MRGLLLCSIMMVIVHSNSGRVLTDCKCNSDLESENCDCSEMCAENEFYHRCPYRCGVGKCQFSKELRSLLSLPLPEVGQVETCLTDVKNTKKCPKGKGGLFPECLCKSGHIRDSASEHAKCITQQECDDRFEEHKCNKPHEYYEKCPKNDDVECKKMEISAVYCRDIEEKVTTPTANTFANVTFNGPSYLRGISKSISRLDKCFPPHPVPNAKDREWNCHYCYKAGCRCDQGFVRDNNGNCVEPYYCWHSLIQSPK